VLVPQKDIIEVNNAIKLYNILNKLNPLSILTLLESHRLLIEELISGNGNWLRRGVGVFKGAKVSQLNGQSQEFS
jgi:hypothetical protein